LFLGNETRAKSGFVSYVSFFLCFDFDPTTNNRNTRRRKLYRGEILEYGATLYSPACWGTVTRDSVTQWQCNPPGPGPRWVEIRGIRLVLVQLSK
jgi:hypothetical protein